MNVMKLFNNYSFVCAAAEQVSNSGVLYCITVCDFVI